MKHLDIPGYNLWSVLATNPAKKKSSKVEHGFKVTSDGRLIIRDEDEEGRDEGRTLAGCWCRRSEHVVARNDIFGHNLVSLHR